LFFGEPYCEHVYTLEADLAKTHLKIQQTREESFSFNVEFYFSSEPGGKIILRGAAGLKKVNPPKMITSTKCLGPSTEQMPCPMTGFSSVQTYVTSNYEVNVAEKKNPMFYVLWFVTCLDIIHLFFFNLECFARATI